MPNNIILEFIFVPFKSLHHQNSRFHHSVESAVVAVEPAQICTSCMGLFVLIAVKILPVHATRDIDNQLHSLWFLLRSAQLRLLLSSASINCFFAR